MTGPAGWFIVTEPGTRVAGASVRLRAGMAATVLICDDEESLRALARATLDGGNYELIEARDGHEALELAGRVRPTLILLDMMMPGLTGLGVLAELRADPELAETSVIVLTASTRPTDRDAALAAGADRFLAKPFSPRELVALVEELLGEARA